MKKSISTTIKAITEGAIFTAFYALLALIGKYLSVDSLIYYFTPLPIAIYVARNKISYSIAVFFASVLISFLFVADPILALFVIMPNIIVGFLFGALEKYSKLKILNYALVIVAALLASFLNIYAYELIMDVKYFEDVILLFEQFGEYFSPNIKEILPTIVEISTIIVLILDAVIKSVLLYLIFAIVVKRLKLIPDYTLKISVPLKYHFSIALIYILIFILSSLSLLALYNNDNVVTRLFSILFLSIMFLFSFYLMYQFVFFIKCKFKQIKNGIFVLIIILLFILYPVSVLGGIILNLINYNILIDMI